eukprot:1000984-Prorocentrum_minimum.AAC.1
MVEPTQEFGLPAEECSQKALHVVGQSTVGGGGFVGTVIRGLGRSSKLGDGCRDAVLSVGSLIDSSACRFSILCNRELRTNVYILISDITCTFFIFFMTTPHRTVGPATRPKG